MADFPSFAISFATAPAALANCPPLPRVKSMLCMVVPKGMLRKGVVMGKRIVGKIWVVVRLGMIMKFLRVRWRLIYPNVCLHFDSVELATNELPLGLMKGRLFKMKEDLTHVVKHFHIHNHQEIVITQ